MLVFENTDASSAAGAGLFALLCALGVAGNTAVVAATLCGTERKTVTAVLVFNVALMDALVALADLPRAVSMAAGQWPFGSVLCKLHVSVRYLNMLARVYVLVIMSLDRYVVAHHRACSRAVRSGALAWALSVFVWILAFILTTPVLLMATARPQSGGRAGVSPAGRSSPWPAAAAAAAGEAAGEAGLPHAAAAPALRPGPAAGVVGPAVCALDFPKPAWWWAEVWRWATLGVGCAIPLATLLGCYAASALRTCASLRPCALAHRGGGQRRRRRRPRIWCRATRFVLSVLGVYLACWAPTFGMLLAGLAETSRHGGAAGAPGGTAEAPFLEGPGSFGGGGGSGPSSSWRCVALLAAAANGCINPLLYACYDRRFRQEIGRALAACRWRGAASRKRLAAEPGEENPARGGDEAAACSNRR
uniref:Delta-type opioid receptor-like n=1 Tax=Petromyzon marinus TaxID=7757 RepID=A0AAJ7WT63_PETMA|nr:delta-type opioid receptor-like [Petromyzon marinus]